MRSRRFRWLAGVLLLCGGGLLSPQTHADPALSPTAQRVRPELFGVADDTTFVDGTNALYLQNGDFKVVFDKNWGGAIREIWFRNANLVNNHDGGRLIGVSLYDGSDSYGTGTMPGDPTWGWNPTPSDKYDHVNRPLEYSFRNGVLYIKDRHIHWNPDNKGGGRTTAIPGDVIVEMSYELLGTNPGVVRMSHRLTHDGTDSHSTAWQEFPYAYIRAPFTNIVRYAGNTPWVNAPVTIGPTVPPFPPSNMTQATEFWTGFVDANDVGLVVWAPQNYSMANYNFHNNSGTENACYYTVPTAFFDLSPGSTIESESYLLAGRWQDARARIYALRPAALTTDVMSPLGFLDLPTGATTLAGTIDVAGWAIDNSGVVAKVEIALDGAIVDRATLGFSRPDVAAVYPGVPGALNSGFRTRLDTRRFANGTHALKAVISDGAGWTRTAMRGTISVSIQN